MSLGPLTKGASWEEIIQACLQSFGKSLFKNNMALYEGVFALRFYQETLSLQTLTLL